MATENNAMKISYNAPLNPLDTETQTFGCRANNPLICANNGIDNICAFASSDGICKKPSRAWKKKFIELKGGDN